MSKPSWHWEKIRKVVAPVAKRWREGRSLALTQLAEPARPFLTAVLAMEEKVPLAIVLPGVREQEYFYSDLETWLSRLCPDEFELLFFPEEESALVEGALHDPQLEAERWATLLALGSSKKTPIVLASELAWRQPLPAPDKLRSGRREVRRGERLDLEEFLAELADEGYEIE
ncbi:MAG: hypothetical protein JO053_07430, partial [Acidobacteria bacterium]|nr:hypothetical protein [Acidobacteriota bacterium]